MDCEEPNCLARLFSSIKAKCLSLNEMLANLYCAAKEINTTLKQLKDKYEDWLDRDHIFSYFYEVWSYNETLTVSERPVGKMPITGNLQKIIITFTESPDDPGTNPVYLNIILDGAIIASIVSSVEFYELDVNIGALKGVDLSIQITNAPDLPSDDSNWKGLGIYTFILEQ